MYRDSGDAIEHFHDFFAQSCTTCCSGRYSVTRFSIFGLGGPIVIGCTTILGTLLKIFTIFSRRVVLYTTWIDLT